MPFSPWENQEFVFVCEAAHCGQAKSVKSLFLFRTGHWKRDFIQRFMFMDKKKAILADGRVGRCIDMKSERAKQL